MASTTPDSRRREFLKRSLNLALAAAGISTSPWPLLAATQTLIRKPIPASGELIPVIGMGTSRTFDVSDDPDTLKRLTEVLQIFFDRGGAVVDSSPMYGEAEQVTGDILKRIQNKQSLFAATKVWTWGREEGIEQMQRSMRRMGVKRFDLIQIHNLRDWQVQLQTLQEWKAEGKVRYIGITTSHGRFHDELESILQEEELDFVQFSYNIANPTVEQRLLPIAQERGIATLVNRPFARGDLFAAVRGKTLPTWTKEFDCQSWGQYFLKYVVSHPAVTCAIPATSKPKHMRDNMGAGYGKLPDAAMRKRMREYFLSL